MPHMLELTNNKFGSNVVEVRLSLLQQCTAHCESCNGAT